MSSIEWRYREPKTIRSKVKRVNYKWPLSRMDVLDRPFHA